MAKNYSYKFKAKGYGSFRTHKSDFSSVTRVGKKRSNVFMDIMGTRYRGRRNAAKGNAFISGMGL